jgi:PhnB protein
MARLLAYMLFDGDCAAAIRFYQRIFGGEIEALTTVGETPMASQLPPSSADRVLHACLRFDGNTLMASDWMVATPYRGINGMRFMLSFDSVEEAGQVFAALSEEGQVEMPMQKTFWARSFGMLVDRHGAPWQILVQ